MRKLANWIDSFFESTAHLPSPTLFRKWAGISLLAGAVERKVWVRSMGSNLYPNLYVVLVAPPGVGKTILTSQIYKYWKELKDHHVASSSVTKASLIDELHLAQRDIIRPNENPSIISFNSLLIACDELGVLIPGYENDFMNTLTALYDCHPYGERRRSKEINIQVPSPQLNLVAATTPSYLNNVMPEGAWDQGFISRVILIYSGETIKRPLFDEPDAGEELHENLITDLKEIAKLYGQVKFTHEAAELVSNWHMSGGDPAPDHPNLSHYLTRRTAHILKLSTLASIAESNKLQVTPEHFRRALDWLVEAEEFMPDIFKAMKSGGDSRAIEATWHYAYEYWVRKKEPIPETQLINFIQERVPAHTVERILQVMVKGGALVQKIGANGRNAYQPTPKRAA